MSKIVKKRYWAFVLYPESAPKNWLDILQETGLPCCVSPLHDKDINPDNTPKKPHYHIILCYGSPTTYNNVLNLTQNILKQTIPIPLEQVKGYYRYLTHLDNPEKYQYSSNDIKCFNGFCSDDYISLTSTQINQIKVEILKFIDDNNIIEYCDLLEILRKIEKFNLLDISMNHTILFNTYITSKRHKKENNSDVRNDILL